MNYLININGTTIVMSGWEGVLSFSLLFGLRTTQGNLLGAALKGTRVPWW